MIERRLSAPHRPQRRPIRRDGTPAAADKTANMHERERAPDRG
jgi:hypothetical protein